MKKFSNVELERIQSFKNKNFNTVHRSSLLVPSFKGSETIITFLNHFLIKRKINEISLKITALNNSGKRISSNTLSIEKPKVYEINLSSMFTNEAKNYILEFYSANNLAIPFPAVIINHLGKNFCNSVHSYNRVLNDVFENDSQNKIKVSEASVDVLINKTFDTFFVFSSGQEEVKNQLLKLVYLEGKKVIKKNIVLNLNRLSYKKIYLSKYLKKINSNGVLKIDQPSQNMFYGRLMVGRENKKNKSFSANHSYYDNSKFKEYLKSNKSFRTYPYFENFINKISMYPIMSPSKLQIKIIVHSLKKDYIASDSIFISPSNATFNLNINEYVEKMNLKNITAFSVLATTKKKEIPSRINHQLIYGKNNSKNSLNSSINLSLKNNSIFKKKLKKFYKWGQLIAGDNYDSKIGICLDSFSSKNEKILFKLYNKNGKFKSKNYTIEPKKALILDPKNILKNKKILDFFWFSIECKNNDISAYVVHSNKASGNTSGEHNF